VPAQASWALLGPFLTRVKARDSGEWGVLPYQTEKSILNNKFSLGVGAKINMRTCAHVAHFDALANCFFVCFEQ